MNQELQRFWCQSLDAFFLRMETADSGDWDLFNEVLDVGLVIQRPEFISRAFEIISESTNVGENIINVACSILFYALHHQHCVLNQKSKNIIKGLLGILENKNYTHARFRAARVIFLLGRSESKPGLVSENDFYKSVDVLKEFLDDDDVCEIIMEDLAQID